MWTKLFPCFYVPLCQTTCKALTIWGGGYTLSTQIGKWQGEGNRKVRIWNVMCYERGMSACHLKDAHIIRSRRKYPKGMTGSSNPRVWEEDLIINPTSEKGGEKLIGSCFSLHLRRSLRQGRVSSGSCSLNLESAEAKEIK